MYVIHELPDGAWSVAIKHPDPTSPVAWDFGTQQEVRLRQDDVVSFANQGGCAFAPDMAFASRPSALPLAANRSPGRVVPLQRKRRALPSGFVSGYDTYADKAALLWREKGVSQQPILVAGVFALSSIQTTIGACLRLLAGLTPYLIQGSLPDRRRLRRLIDEAGTGLGASRIRWFAEYQKYTRVLHDALNGGLHDDALRHDLAVVRGGTPDGLGLAKLSFVLALLGNDTGCLDSRILSWALGTKMDLFLKDIGRKTERGSFVEWRYNAYRANELNILESSAYYLPSSPLPLARAQWALWEALGDAESMVHTHEELYRAVRDDRLNQLPAWAEEFPQ